MKHIFSGLITALITPFKDGALNHASLERLIKHQSAAGVKAIVIAGSTGEAPSLEFSEYDDLVKSAVRIASSLEDKMNIIAGCTASSTNLSIKLAKIAEEAGADALMCATPPYNKPSQEGLFQHFKALHDNSALPIMLYSIPGRTGGDFTDETILRLASMPRICAIKDCCGDFERPIRIQKQAPDFIFMCGDDSASLAFNAQGASGVVSVASNIFPALVKKVQDLWESGKIAEAIMMQRDLISFYKSLFIETNPCPAKYAAYIAGLCEAEVRLPLCEPSLKSKEIIEKEVRELMLKNHLSMHQQE